MAQARQVVHTFLQLIQLTAARQESMLDLPFIQWHGELISLLIVGITAEEIEGEWLVLLLDVCDGRIQIRDGEHG